MGEDSCQEGGEETEGGGGGGSGMNREKERGRRHIESNCLKCLHHGLYNTCRV